jgi:hypothetical protein
VEKNYCATSLSFNDSIIEGIRSWLNGISSSVERSQSEKRRAIVKRAAVIKRAAAATFATIRIAFQVEIRHNLTVFRQIIPVNR